MKNSRIRNSIFALSLLAFFSCQKEEIIIDTPETVSQEILDAEAPSVSAFYDNSDKESTVDFETVLFSAFDEYPEIKDIPDFETELFSAFENHYNKTFSEIFSETGEPVDYVKFPQLIDKGTIDNALAGLLEKICDESACDSRAEAAYQKALKTANLTCQTTYASIVCCMNGHMIYSMVRAEPTNCAGTNNGGDQH